MSKFPKSIFIFLILSLAVIFASPTEAAETFTFQGRNTLHLIIDSYKTTSDGWTPVLLSLQDLEFSLWMDVNGRVFESPQRKLHGPRPLFIIDTIANALNLRDRSFPLLIRSQNQKRTRIRLMDKYLPVTLTIDNEMQKATLHLDKAPLDLGVIKAEFIEIEPGTHQLKFSAPNIQTTEKFIYLESTETLYATHKQKVGAGIADMPNIPDMSKSRIWLKKIHQGGAK